MADAVAEKVIATLASVKRIPAEKITMDTNLQEMGIDSLDVFTLLFELENAFKISIPDDDVRSIKTVNDIVEGVKKMLAAAPPGRVGRFGQPGGLTDGAAPGRNHRSWNYFPAGSRMSPKTGNRCAKDAPPSARSSPSTARKWGLKIQNGAEVRGFDPLKHFAGGKDAQLDRFAQFSVVAAREAMGDSGLELTPEHA